jgi:hypothetical protein
VDRVEELGFDRTGFVDRLTDDVHDAAERGGADRHGDRVAEVGDVLTADQAFSGVHSDGADGVFTQVLGDFQNQTRAGGGVGGFQGVQDGGHPPIERHVDDGPDDLGDTAFGGSNLLLCGHGSVPTGLRRRQ